MPDPAPLEAALKEAEEAHRRRVQAEALAKDLSVHRTRAAAALEERDAAAKALAEADEEPHAPAPR